MSCLEMRTDLPGPSHHSPPSKLPSSRVWALWELRPQIWGVWHDAHNPASSISSCSFYQKCVQKCYLALVPIISHRSLQTLACDHPLLGSRLFAIPLRTLCQSARLSLPRRTLRLPSPPATPYFYVSSLVLKVRRSSRVLGAGPSSREFANGACMRKGARGERSLLEEFHTGYGVCVRGSE
jgi:hypothetical protein